MLDLGLSTHVHSFTRAEILTMEDLKLMTDADMAEVGLPKGPRLRIIDALKRIRGGAAPGGVVVVSTFGPDGPERCAGLPVRRYDCGSLAAEFEPDFELVSGGPIVPPIAAGDQRPYVAAVLRRVGPG